jgi:hypothetical protein
MDWQINMHFGPCALSVTLAICIICVVRDSSVGNATYSGMDGLGIEPQWLRYFPRPSRQALGPTRPPVQWVPALFSGVKAGGRCADHPPTSSGGVKERVQLYLYSTSGLLWAVLIWNSPLLLFVNMWIFLAITSCKVATFRHRLSIP